MPRGGKPSARVRRAGVADAATIGRLLHDFNLEFHDPTPEPDVLAERIVHLLEAGEVTVLVAGESSGLAVLRFRPSLWRDARECYLEELYVVPDRRGEGLGRALMEAAIEVARSEDAKDMHLATNEQDVAARSLYESLGFSNRAGRPNGPTEYYYEREL